MNSLLTPTPNEISQLLAEAGLTAYAAGNMPILGISARQLQNAIKGERDLQPSTWAYIRLVLSKSARAELPDALAP